MLRVRGKTVAQQLKDMEKDPSLALTTGRPLPPNPNATPEAKHPGLSAGREKINESKRKGKAATRDEGKAQ